MPSGVCACAVAYGWLEAGVALVVDGRGGSLVATVGDMTPREPLRPCMLVGFVFVRLRLGKAGSGEVERLEEPVLGVGNFERGSVGR